MVTRTQMTAAEYLKLPETNTPMELLNGELVVSPSPITDHQRTVFSSAKLIEKQVKGGEVFVAPLDVYFDELNIPQPDVMWVAPDSKCVIERTRLNGAPDLIVEVLSTGTERKDRVAALTEKFDLYQKYGVREYWIVDAAEQLIEVWQHDGSKFVRLGLFVPGEMFESALVGTVEVKAIFGE